MAKTLVSRYLLIIFICLLIKGVSFGQKLNPHVNRDSLINAELARVPKETALHYRQAFDSASEKEKVFLLYVLCMPRSSKAEMIVNLQNNEKAIAELNRRFAKLVPVGYNVYIEFKPAVNIFQVPASVDMFISKEPNGVLEQKWNMGLESKELKKMLNMLHWKRATLDTVKKLLDDAYCISIENGNPTNIGYSRSGMGKYCFKVFDHNLDEAEQKKYNDGCINIFYKDNIVLEYGSGAVGSLCFPD